MALFRFCISCCLFSFAVWSFQWRPAFLERPDIGSGQFAWRTLEPNWVDFENRSGGERAVGMPEKNSCAGCAYSLAGGGLVLEFRKPLNIKRGMDLRVFEVDDFYGSGNKPSYYEVFVGNDDRSWIRVGIGFGTQDFDLDHLKGPFNFVKISPIMTSRIGFGGFERISEGEIAAIDAVQGLH